MKTRHNYLFTYRYPGEHKTRFWRSSVQDLAAQRRWFKRNRPDYILDSVELDWVTPLLAELGKPENEAALKRLRDKCRWEKMSLSAVLLEYGDPRTWR